MKTQKQGVPKPHLYSLDALRGVAALSVVFWHWQHFFYQGTRPGTFRLAALPFAPVADLFYTKGWLAVDLFFTISGFIFYDLYADRIAKGQIDARQFALLRFSRLYPLAFVTLLAVAIGQAIAYLTTGDYFVYPANDAAHFVEHLFLISLACEGQQAFNSPTWSITVEIGLYFVFFVVCRWLSPRAGLAFMVSVLGVVVVSIASPTAARGFASFFVGGCVFHLSAAIQQSEARHTWRRLALVVTLALIFTGIVGYIIDFDMANHVYFARSQIAGGGVGRILHAISWRIEPYWVTLGLFPVLVLTLALYDDAIEVFSGQLAFLGEISYSSYLVHFPLQLFVFLLINAFSVDRSIYYSTGFMLVFFAVLITLSLLSFRKLERPMQRYLRTRLDWR